MKINSFVSLLVAAVLTTLAGTAQAQILNPITGATLSGPFAGDGIFGPTTGDNTATTTIDGGTGNGGAFHYVEKGYYAGDPTYGLPATGTIVSPSTGTTFQLQAPNATNVIKDNGTITLATPGIYTEVGFLVNSLSNGSGNAPASFTLNFSSGSPLTLTTAGDVPYWSLGDPTSSGGTYALISNNAIDQSGGENGSGIGFFEYDFTLPSPYLYKTLDSVTINANGSDLRTYAISGVVGVAPEPSTWALMFAGIGALFFVGRMRRKQNV